MTDSKTPKSDERRALRERWFAALQAKTKAQPTPAVERVAIAKTIVDNAQKAKPLSTSNADRQRKWREANPEVHRERSRDVMRIKRAKAV